MGGCRVSVDLSRCSSIGLCEAGAPDVFEIGADGAVHLLADEVDQSRRQDLEEVAANCPTQSITVSAGD